MGENYLSNVKKSNLNINELFKSEEKLTFLVGAGASVDSPSQLPSASNAMRALIKFFCSKSEVEKILSIQGLSFEALVRILHNSLNGDFEFLDFYLESDKPNIEHFFLADMIKKGHYLATTNFDFLIEHALLQTQYPKKKIVPVITEKDYQRFSDPEKLYKNKRIPIYKLHSSPKNIITGENTRTSFNNTLKLIGSNHDKKNIIQLEPFKAQMLERISNERTLIIMGYSAKNDYDLISTLKTMNRLKNLVWINHTSNSKIKGDLYEYNKPESRDLSNSGDLDQHLLEIKRLNESINVFRLNINTPKFLEKLLAKKEEISKEKFKLNLADWLKAKIKEPSDLTKLFISNKIYFETMNYSDALRCLEGLYMAKSEDSHWKAISLMEMGIINYEQSNYVDALDSLHKSLQVQIKSKSMPERALIFKYIGLVYHKLRKYSEAIKNFNLALKELEKIKDLNQKAEIYNNLSVVYQEQHKYEDALMYLESAIKINGKFENLSKIALNLKLKGKIYSSKKNFSEALKQLQAALKISEQLEDLEQKAEILNIIGRTTHEIGDSLTGLEKCNESLNIYNLLGGIEGKLDALNSIGIIYRDQWNYPKAFDYFEEGSK